MFKSFGAKISQEDMEAYSHSEHWNGEAFENLEKTENHVGLMDIPGLIFKQYLQNSKFSPQDNLPILLPDLAEWERRDNFFVWYGHSVLFLKLNGLHILIDPMFGNNAAPISPFPVKRFSKESFSIIDLLPPIDYILLTHDHYDHLDYDSIQKLKSKTQAFLVALGVKRHLVKWGIPSQKIIEMDWWDTHYAKGMEIHFTPTRHFGGRRMSEQNKSFWGGWALKTDSINVWFSGDGGYGKHFKEIGQELGPFDIGFIECGQYNDLWNLIHLFPEESVKVCKEVGVQTAVPVHWGGFALAQHPWQESVERFLKEAKREGLGYGFPRLGQVFDLENLPREEWWRGFK